MKLLGSTHDESTRRQVAESLGKIGTDNKEVIAALVKLLGSTHDYFTLRQAVESLGLIGMGNEAASTALVKLLGSTKNERIRSLTVESLEKIGMNNKEASMALLELLGSTKNNLTYLAAVNSLEKIGTSKETVIAALVKLLGSTYDRSILWQAAESLEKIGTGNEAAIKGLVKILESTYHGNIRWQAFESLEKIGAGNEAAIKGLVKLLESTHNENNPGQLTRRQVARRLKKIMSLEKISSPHNFAKVINVLKNSLNDSQVFNYEYYGLIWHFAQNMSYPAFYQAWHKNTLANLSTQSLDLANLPQILSGEISTNPNLSDKVKLICIDGSKFIERDDPAEEIYDQMLDYDCPERQNGEPEMMPKLKLYWNSLRRRSDSTPVLVFYENPTGRKPQGFSEVFLDALSAFDGALCVVTDQPLDNINLHCFTPNQTAKDVVAWISQN